MSTTDTVDTPTPAPKRRTKVTEVAEQLDLPASKRLNQEKFWDYWRNAEQQFPDRTYCYVYRKWPVINRQQVNTDNPNSIDKINFMEIKDFATKFGNGDYNLILTDPYKAGPGHKKIADVFLSIREPDNPPVLDYHELVLSDPANAEYIQQLRARGTPLPGDEDVMTKETTAVLAGTIKDLVENRTPPSGVESAVTKGVVETLNHASKASNELLSQSFAQALRVQVSQPDPIETMSKAAEIIRSFQPQNGTGELLPLFLQMMKDSQAAATAQFQTQMEAIKESNRLTRDLLMNRAPAEAPPPTAASRFQERLEEKMFEDLLNGGSRKGDNGTDWMKIIQFAAPLASSLVGGLLQASYNYALAKGVVPPPPPQADNPQPPVPQQTQHPQEENMYQNLLNMVAQPMLNHLDQQLTGADFADFIIQGYGRTIYDMVRQAGTETVLTEIGKHPHLGRIAAQIPDRFAAFVEQFINRDKIRAAEDTEED